MITTDIFASVRHELGAVEAKLREIAPNQHEALTGATEHLLASGGKRVRPALALLAASAFGAETQRAVALAAAVEMLHTATLVHDDLIDGSLLRRGIPTLNAQWTPAATVLTGDYLFARAASLAAETDSVEVMDVFARTLMVIVNGEINQLFISRGRASRDDYYRRIYAKTASMFALATEAGAILGAAGDSAIAAMRDYGKEVGMAFQIVDDILDYVGDEAHVGKPVGNDLRQGLVTLPALYFLESHPDDPHMAAILNGRSGDPAQVAVVVDSIRASGAVNEAMAEARRFVAKGRDALSAVPDGLQRDALDALADYVVRRDL
ncbi:MAG: polyprenyl synthetase family protein [Chloroflexi bacterium]|nr:polyprenyl synthetase family protein [Chloroflexota bacterium]MBI3762166.1 polyprenyl synthetase family protein [Chloroflexota bacterium]